MEMEHINENTIRVRIENADLEERGVTFLDLLGNHKQIENFFYSILEEVDVENQFHGTDAVTFQVMPKGNGLELFISKGNATNEELDMNDGDPTSQDDFTKFIKEQILGAETPNIDESEVSEYLENPDTLKTEFVFKIAQFEDMVLLAKRMYLDSAVSSLYHYKDAYYLQVVFFNEEMIETTVDEEVALILEFATETNLTGDVLSEYGKLIMEQTALEQTRYYFK
ncbi:adaptor protein MecA [Isobaculum melis]|uniref:Adapter protein MecA n=1 Tax=Isobaculum melis TaxID=142588 RepID=A0A1H9TAR3_9LACT|nr:adaptor protein MecA [Isobaculum melis]SER93859.1 adapter protein MecA 1/2 [Isobaculum melis]